MTSNFLQQLAQQIPQQLSLWDPSQLNFIQILSWSFLAAGSAFVLIGVIGLLRLPNIYARLHAASLTDTLGLELMIIGLIIHAGWSIISIKLLFIGLFILITGPTAAHALANAAFISKIPINEKKPTQQN